MSNHNEGPPPAPGPEPAPQEAPQSPTSPEAPAGQAVDVPANAETAGTAEKWSPKAVDDAVEATITNASRAVIAGIMTANPDTSYTANGLVKEVNNVQSTDSPSKLPKGSNNRVMRQAQALVDAGLATAASDPNTGTTIVAATKKGEHYAPAVGGSIAAWQERHPDVPATSIVGHTNRPAGENERGSAMLRLAVVERVQKGDAPSHTEIANDIEEKPARVSGAIRNLEDEGIVNVEHKTDLSQQRIFVNRGNIPPPQTAGTPMGAAIREAAENFENAQNVNAEEFVREVHRINPQLPKDDVWKYMVKANTRPTERMPVQIQPFAGDDRLTKVTVTPESAEAVNDLVKTVDKLRAGDTQTIQEGEEKMNEILTVPAVADEVIDYANKNGVPDSKTDEEWMEAIQGLVPKKGIDAHALHERVLAAGHRISYIAFRRRIAGLPNVDVSDTAQSTMNTPLGQVQITGTPTSSAAPPKTSTPSNAPAPPSAPGATSGQVKGVLVDQLPQLRAGSPLWGAIGQATMLLREAQQTLGGLGVGELGESIGLLEQALGSLTLASEQAGQAANYIEPEIDRL